MLMYFCKCVHIGVQINKQHILVFTFNAHMGTSSEK